MTRVVVTLIRAAVWLGLAAIVVVIVVIVLFALFGHSGY